MDDDETTTAAPAPGDDTEQTPKTKYNPAGVYAATQVPIQASETEGNQQVQQLLAGAKTPSTPLMTAQPAVSTAAQNPIYDMIFSKSNQPAETIQPPPIPMPTTPPPTMQVASDRRLKTNVKSADRNMQDFLSKLSSSDMFNRMK